MGFDFVISKLGSDDFDLIQSYLKANVSEEYATKIKRMLLDKIQVICQEPKLYRIIEEARYVEKQIRRVPIEGYLIFYKVNESKKLIVIGRIRSDKQNNRNIKV